MFTNFAIEIIRYAYLFLLWLFVLSVISLLRKDIFSKVTNAHMSSNQNDYHNLQIVEDPSAKTPEIIKIVEGINQGDCIELSCLGADGGMTIGRDADNSLPIADEHLSAQHAEIFADNGSYYIQDLGSKNGIYIDGSKIKRNSSIELSVGQMIQLGRNQLQVL